MAFSQIIQSKAANDRYPTMNSSKFRIFLRFHLLGIWSCTSLAMANPDVFDQLGMSPEQVAAELPKLESGPFSPRMATPFTGWPMSSENRARFIENLRSVAQPAATRGLALDSLLDMLEEDGRYEDALKEIPTDAWTPDGRFTARKVGLLWKAGKTEAAAAAVKQITSGPGWQEGWFAAISVDLATRRADRAMDLLGFLLKRADLSADAFAALAQQRVELAWLAGKTDAVLADEPDGATKAYYLALMGREEEALASLHAAGPLSDSRDLALLASLQGVDGKLRDDCLRFLEKPSVPADARASLLNAITDEKQRFTLFLQMPDGHAETLRRLKNSVDWSSFALGNLIPTSARILAKHPDDPALNLQHGLLVESTGGDADKFFIAALNDSTATRSASSNIFEAPAIEAIKQLARSRDFEELERLVISIQDFDKLPDAAKLSRMMAAGLDYRLAEVFEQCPFDQPDQDSVSGDLAIYLGAHIQTPMIPETLLRTVVRKLPELVLGSSSKKPSSIASDSPRWMALLAVNKVPESTQAEALHRLYEAAVKRGGDTPRLVSRWASLSLKAKAGIPNTQPTPKVSPQSAWIFAPPWLKALGIFGPPQSIGGNRGEAMATQLQMRRYAMDSRPTPNIPPPPSLAMSAWSENVNCTLSALSTNQIAEIAAKLRGLLEIGEPRAQVYDSLFARSALIGKDEAIRKTAEEHVKLIDASDSPPADPDIKTYLFLTRILSSGKPTDELRGLPDLTKTPVFVRNRVRMAVQQFMGTFSRDSRVREYISSRTMDPSRPAAPEVKRIEPYDKLKFYEEAGQSSTGECLAFAEQVLTNFLASGRRGTDPQENLAISILVENKRFDGYLAKVRERMEKAGNPEVGIQRAFYKLHLYRIIHKNGESVAIAKKIFALDPTDADAAAVIAHTVAAEGDMDTTLKCLTALARKSRAALRAVLPVVIDPDADDSRNRQVFSGSNIKIVARHLLALPPPRLTGRSYNYQPESENPVGFLSLLLIHDHEDFDPMIHWLRLDDKLSFKDLMTLARSLVLRDRKDEAVRFLADKLLKVAPMKSAGDGIRFPLRKISESPAERSVIIIDELERLGVLKPLSAIAEATTETPQNRIARVLLIVGADPRSETWERIARPVISSLSEGEMKSLIWALKQVSSNSQGGAFITRQLGEEQRKHLPSDLENMDPASRIGRLAESTLPDRPQRIAEAWTKLESTIGNTREDHRILQYVTVAIPLALAADDTVWRSFLEKIRGLPGFGDQWINRTGSATPSGIPSSRLRELAEIALGASKANSIGAMKMEGIFDLLASEPSVGLETLRPFRPWLLQSGRYKDDNHPAKWRVTWLDLLEGNPAAVQPTIDVVRKGETTWQVRWSLASLNTNKGKVVMDSGFPLLDGKFDLTFLAGPDAQHLSRIGDRGSAKARGSLDLEAPADSASFVLMASERDGSAVRMTPDTAPRDLRQWKPVPMDAVKDISKTLPNSGPFATADAVEIPIRPHSRTMLASIPWFGDEVPDLSLWFRNNASNVDLKIEFANIGGEVLRSVSIGNQQPFCGGKSWSLAASESFAEVPVETRAVNLVFDAARCDVSLKLAVADLMAAPVGPFVPPPGVTRAGQLPARVAKAALSRDEKRVAVESEEQGVGYFDLETQRFSGWVPLQGKGGSGMRGVSWLAMAGDRIARANVLGEVQIISMKDKRVIPVELNPQGQQTGDEAPSLAFSADGRFIAKAAVFAGLHLAMVGEDGAVKTRSIETPRLHGIAFDDPSTVLRATTGSSILTLPLKDWEQGQPSTVPTVPGPNLWAEFPRESERIDTLPKSGLRIVSRADRNRGPRFEIDPKSGGLYLPEGRALLTRDENLVLIDRMGWIHQIRTTDLKGYAEFATKGR